MENSLRAIFDEIPSTRIRSIVLVHWTKFRATSYFDHSQLKLLKVHICIISS